MVYYNEYKKSIENSEAFWAEQAEKIHWFEKPIACTVILDPEYFT